MTPANPFAIIDGHNDTLLHLYSKARGEGVTFFDRSETGHIDLPRAREGGLGGGFFAIYIPNDSLEDSDAKPGALPSGNYLRDLPPPLELPYAQKHAFGMARLLFEIERASQGEVKVVRSADELQYCLDNNIFATILHFEGAEPIDPDLNALEVFYQAGLRSLGPVWSRSTAFAHGVPFGFPHSPDTGPGLTDAGKELVRACNQLGIMIDLSHMNEKGFWDVAAISDKPLVATHSNVHAICPVSRNLTDKQLDAIKESDGIVGLNYAVAFLREDGANNKDTPIETMVRHIDYLVERLGIDRVALGSDFDGATIPNEIGDVSGNQKLIAALRERGYDEASLRKIGHENWLRVLRKTWKA